MEDLKQIFQKRAALENTRPPSLFRSERDELMAKFANRGIQVRDRKTKELRAASVGEIAKLLCYCPTKDLFAFYQECDRAKNFSMFFWWAVKRRKPNPS